MSRLMKFALLVCASLALVACETRNIVSSPVTRLDR